MIGQFGILASAGPFCYKSLSLTEFGLFKLKNSSCCFGCESKIVYQKFQANILVPSLGGKKGEERRKEWKEEGRGERKVEDDRGKKRKGERRKNGDKS